MSHTQDPPPPTHTPIKHCVDTSVSNHTVLATTAADLLLDMA
jgi:hypothetical protein